MGALERGPGWAARVAAALLVAWSAACVLRAQAPSDRVRPNILIAVADDWGWPHAGAYGDRVVATPTFDRLARDGVLFASAFCSSPSCTPSRNAILTGQAFFRLGEGANLWSSLAPEHRTFPELLAAAGYAVGHWRKAWGPGDWRALGREVPPAGPSFGSFETFLAARGSRDVPFCFWLGSSDPHRGYEAGSGRASGIELADVVVPPPYPDAETIRSDIADYYVEVQRFDRDVGRALALLDERGELENTLVIMTSDHGWPFPRGKTNLYDLGSRVPLAVRIGSRVAADAVADRAIEALVSLTDLAPTILDVAGIDVPSAMTGRSLLPMLLDGDANAEPWRDHVVFGRERHTIAQEGDGRGYPMRAVRTSRWLYVRNYRPADWPAGYEAPGARPFRDCDNGPTKSWLLANRDAEPLAFALCFGRRPYEELYDLANDPWQLHNLAGEPLHQEARAGLVELLHARLGQLGDPRSAVGDAGIDSFRQPQRRPKRRQKEKPAKVVEPPPRKEYMGRRIARTMHWRGAGWLLRETREKEEHVTKLLTALGVEPGMTVCDFGCGNGCHTLPLAEQVGPSGRVLAVDIQEQMLKMLAQRAKRAGVEDSIERILSTSADPKLEAGTCDLILLVDVYHELAHPEYVLRALRAALKPNGRLALVEFRGEDPKVPIKKLHKMTKAQATKELAANGLRLADAFDELPWQHLLFFERDEAWVASPAAAARRDR